MGILAAIAKYGKLVLSTVQDVQTTLGPGGGADKKTLAVAIVLAGAHAGEQVGNETVVKIATVVDLVVGILNMQGKLGAAKTTAISVPPADPQPVSFNGTVVRP